MLSVFDTGISTAEENMLFDTRLLENLDPKSDPILHFYDWKKDSITFGYFIDPEKHLDLKILKKRGIDFARRPTGGGIVFHIWDMAFSFLMPAENPNFSLNPLDNYRFVNQSVLEAVQDFFHLEAEMIPMDAEEKGIDCKHFCMARPTKYDVIYQGKKIAGAAQRRRKQGYLHQGTISLALPNQDLLKEVLKNQQDIVSAMNFFTFCPIEEKELRNTRILLKKQLAAKLEKRLNF